MIPHGGRQSFRTADLQAQIRAGSHGASVVSSLMLFEAGEVQQPQRAMRLEVRQRQECAGAKPICAVGPTPPVRAYALAIEAKTVPHAIIRALLDGELLLALRTYPSELAFALARGVRLHEGADTYEFFLLFFLVTSK